MISNEQELFTYKLLCNGSDPAIPSIMGDQIEPTFYLHFYLFGSKEKIFNPGLSDKKQGGLKHMLFLNLP